MLLEDDVNGNEYTVGSFEFIFGVILGLLFLLEDDMHGNEHTVGSFDHFLTLTNCCRLCT